MPSRTLSSGSRVNLKGRRTNWGSASKPIVKARRMISSSRLMVAFSALLGAPCFWREGLIGFNLDRAHIRGLEVAEVGQQVAIHAAAKCLDGGELMAHVFLLHRSSRAAGRMRSTSGLRQFPTFGLPTIQTRSEQ